MDHAAALVDENAHVRRPRRGGRPGDAGAHLPGLVAQAAVPARRPRRPVGGHDRAHRPARRSRGRWPTGDRRRAGWSTGCRAGRRRSSTPWPRSGRTPPVWTFTGPRPASWWIRRREHEVLVHRADAALALGADFAVPAERAADGSPNGSVCWTARKFEPGRQPRSPTAPRCTCTPPTTASGRAGEWLSAAPVGGIVVGARARQGRRRRSRARGRPPARADAPPTVRQRRDDRRRARVGALARQDRLLQRSVRGGSRNASAPAASTSTADAASTAAMAPVRVARVEQAEEHRAQPRDARRCRRAAGSR